MSTIAIYTTPPQKEKKALEEFRRARIKAYMPLAKVRRRTSNKKEITQTQPLFPRYTFAKTDRKPDDAIYIGDRKGSMPVEDRTEYVARYRAGKETQARGLSSLMRLARVRPAQPQQTIITFDPGDKVIVTAGAFEGKRGKVQNHAGRGIYRVELDDAMSFGSIPVHQNHMQRRYDPG